jgi:hypothetical protein
MVKEDTVKRRGLILAIVLVALVHALVGLGTAGQAVVCEIADLGVYDLAGFQERMGFKQALATNPNYYGNLVGTELAPVYSKAQDTTYEELMCVGYNPHLEQLHAVVHVKKSSGYLGGICSSGSPEFVRFFVDWNNNGQWVFVGMVRFAAHDIPGQKPLEYALTVDVEAKGKLCTVENLPTVRAILSWNDPRYADDPAFIPVWGNVVDGRIQIEPVDMITLPDLFDFGGLTVPEGILKTLDLSATIQVTSPKSLPLVELALTYKDAAVPVPPHRFAFSEFQLALADPVDSGAAYVELASVVSLFSTDLQLLDVINFLSLTDGDTSYEELTCIGYDSDRRHLTGVFTVKLSSGYSGSLCDEGSKEYVAFWEYDEIEQMWVYLGTSAVSAYDIKSLPAGGLQYAVSLSEDFDHLRRPCTAGASVARIRAILSWNQPPPPLNPDWVPTWGNRLETTIHVKPGPIPSGNTPYIETVGNMAVCDIDQTTGRATGQGIIASFTANESPFGGTITITGYIDNPPSGVMENTEPPLLYRVEVSDDNGATWQPLNNSFDVWVRREIGLSPPVQEKLTQKTTDGMHYQYLEDGGGSHQRYYVLPVLAKWHTTSAHEGLWKIRILTKAGSVTGKTLCVDGSMRGEIAVRLDNERPEATLSIGSSVAGKCGFLKPGDILEGTYGVTDNQSLGALALNVIPSEPAHGKHVAPSSKSFSALSTSWVGKPWTLDTNGMDPCGYVVRLWVRDRTIVNSGSIGWTDTDDVGFCLMKEPEE